MSGNFIKQVFYFSRGQKKGIVVLFTLILLVFAISLSVEEIQFSWEAGFEIYDSLLDSDFSYPEPVTLVELHNFDPNTAGKDELLGLGLSGFAASNLVKYRNRGACFYRKEDLKKVYGLDDALYIKLEPYIVITAGQPVQKVVAERAYRTDRTDVTDRTGNHSQRTESATKPLYVAGIIELNSADSAGLLPLPGIGPVFAGRIIKYRELLGGFYSGEQLNEVYGMPAETYDMIKGMVRADSTLIKRIDINQAGLWDLKRHPYISDYEAEAILAYRKYAGRISSVSEMRDNRLIAGGDFVKFSHYLNLPGESQ